MSDWLTLSIGGIQLGVQDITDTWNNAIARHEPVGRNGANLEWLGAHAGEFRVRAAFVGDQEVAQYVELLKLIRRGAAVVVVHPIHGDFDALVGAVTAKLDRRENTAEVEFSIVEDQVGKEPKYVPHAQDVAIECSQNAIDQGVCQDIANGVRPANLPDVDLTDANWATTLASLGLGNKISGYVRSLAAGLGTIAALRVGLTAPVAAAFNALQFAADMPGQVAYEVAQFLELFAAGRLSNAPDPVLACQRLVVDLSNLQNVFAGGSLESTVRVLGALQAGRSTALSMAADERNLRALVANEQSVTFDLRGNRVGSRLTTLPVALKRSSSSRCIFSQMA